MEEIKKIHYFYKITNLVNNKYYYGIHSTNNLNDGHMGSGKRITCAIKKYGIENFSFEIIKETYDRNYWEIFLIQIYHATDGNFGYNIECGGTYGSPIRTEEERENYREKQREYYRNLPDSEKKRLAKEHSEKMRKRIQEKGATEAEKQHYANQKGKRPLRDNTNNDKS